MRTICLFTICLAVNFNLITISAQAPFTTQKVSVFKNGTGFFIKSGKVGAENGIYVLNSPPEALLGTIWVNTGNEKIKTIKKLSEKGGEKKEAKNLSELISANTGRRVRIIPQTGEGYEATIQKIENSSVILKTKDKWIITDISEIKAIEFTEEPSLKYDYETDKNKLGIEFGTSGTKNLDIMYLQKGISWIPEYLIELSDEKNAVLTLKATLI
ncbi:MAG: hypothetical protein HY738_02510 [Bacteroidia bacterium]|nr:hypothetical protein [Bacteroidia bacterium]